MTITLGDLRTYARETASADVNSSSGDRQIQDWVNSALEEIWIAHDWFWSRSSTKFVMVPEETGSTLALTQGSRVATLDPAQAEVFREKYAKERWYLLVTGEGRQVFEVERVEDAKRAILAEGNEWPNPSATGLSYVWVRSTYPLPGGAMKIDRVEDLGAYGEVVYREPARFDYLQSVSPTHRGNRPEFYTLRRERIELWPGPGGDYVTLGVTYKRPAPHFTTKDPDSLEIDWPVDKKSLIQKAILVQAALTQGENAPTPYALAMTHYELLLKRHKSEDSDKADLGGPMELEGLGHGTVDFSRLGGITDDFA